MLAAIVLLAVGWTWSPVEDATRYEAWCAKAGEPWAHCGNSTDLFIGDAEFFDEPVPAPGELVCITIRAGNDNGLSDLDPCCGPCR